MRAKILVALVGLPSLVLIIMLYFTIKTFEEDKIAYIFETATTVTGAVSAQVENELGDAKLRIVQTSAFLNPLSKSWNNLAQNFFQDAKKLDALLVFDPEDRENFHPHRFVNYLEQPEQKGVAGKLLANPLVDQWIQITQKNEKLFTYDKDLGGFVIGIKNKNLVILGVGRHEQLLREITKPGPYALLVTDEEAHLIVQTDETPSMVPPQQLAEEIKKIAKDGVIAKTMSLAKPDGNLLLVSYKKIPELGLITLSLIDQNEALSMFFTILKKSLLLFIFMLAVSIVVAIIIAEKITSRLYELFLATQKISEGDFDVRIEGRSRDEVGQLARGFNLMAMEIQSLLQQTEGKARMENELKTAQLVQSTFMPESDASYAGLKISGQLEPASECGGDWWHHFQIDNRVYFMVGDVTGHGVSAALMTSSVRAAVDCIQAGMQSPGVVLHFINNSLCRIYKGQSMMTFFLAEFDLNSKILTYANASHEPPLLLEPEKPLLKRQDLIPLQDVISKRLGELPDSEYKEGSRQMKSGDRIFLFTDGVLDLENAQGAALGERRMHELLCKSYEKKQELSETAKGLFADFKTYQGNPLKDDITFFLVEII